MSGSSYVAESPAETLFQAHHPRTPVSETNHLAPDANTGHNSLENAVLDSMHTSTTESVLQWPHFDVFPSLRNDYVSIFELEQSRPALEMKPPSTVYPFVPEENADVILEAFQNNVNFWYPTMSRDQLSKVRLMSKCLNASVTEECTVDSCLAHLTMALGCASQTIAGLSSGTRLTDEELKKRALWRERADLYFDHALRRLHVVHMDVSSVATQCLFFTALATSPKKTNPGLLLEWLTIDRIYFAFLRRPLQAWEYINAASAKCLLLLSYRPPSETAEDLERIRRIFWSCYILERLVDPIVHVVHSSTADPEPFTATTWRSCLPCRLRVSPALNRPSPSLEPPPLRTRHTPPRNKGNRPRCTSWPASP